MGGIASGSREPNHISQKGIIYKIRVYNWVGGIYRVIPARLIININIASIEWRADAATFTSMEVGKKSLRDQFWKEVLIGLLIIYFSFVNEIVI